MSPVDNVHIVSTTRGGNGRHWQSFTLTSKGDGFISFGESTSFAPNQDSTPFPVGSFEILKKLLAMKVTEQITQLSLHHAWDENELPRVTHDGKTVILKTFNYDPMTGKNVAWISDDAAELVSADLDAVTLETVMELPEVVESLNFANEIAEAVGVTVAELLPSEIY